MGTHRSWLGGRGVREAGQGLGAGCKGFGSGGVGGRDTGPTNGANFASLVDGGSGRRGKGSGGGCKGFGSGRVGGRDTGPRDGANFATCVVLNKKKNCVF